MAVFTITTEDEDAEKVVKFLTTLPYVSSIEITYASESEKVNERINGILAQADDKKIQA